MAAVSTTADPPGIGHNFFEIASMLTTDPLTASGRLIRKYGDISYHRLPLKPFYCIQNPEHIVQVFKKDSRLFLKDHGYKELGLLLGDGLISAEGEVWRRQRRIIQPVFKRSSLASFLPVMAECIGPMLSRWQQLGQAGQQINVHQEMMGITLQIISATMFGEDVTSQSRHVAEHLETAQSVIIKRTVNPLNSPIDWPLPANLAFRRAKAGLDKIINGFIARRKRSLGDRKTAENQGDLLDRLLTAVDDESGAGMDDGQLRDEIMTIFTAGHETTAVAMTMVLYFLAQHPEAAKKINEEAQGLSTQDLTDIEKLNGLSYAKNVILESMRLFPPVWAIGRRAKEELEIGGYQIRPDVDIFAFQWFVHRDPRYWSQPTDFKPERFEADPEPGTYFPFGLGPRTCIGNIFAMSEMLLLTLSICRKFNFTTHPNFEMEVEPLVTLRPKKPFYLSLSGRA